MKERQTKGDRYLDRSVFFIEFTAAYPDLVHPEYKLYPGLSNLVQLPLSGILIIADECMVKVEDWGRRLAHHVIVENRGDILHEYETRLYRTVFFTNVSYPDAVT